MRCFVFLFTIFITLSTTARAGEPFFKPGDVVALVGGEDMVVAAELGYLETLIQLALPEHRLKFRSLAREGDTVFEQRRDLNYPSLEVQLEKMGATVVICQFGQMESLMAGEAGGGGALGDKGDKEDKRDSGDAVPLVPLVPQKADATRKAKVADFVVAYEKLIGRLRGKDGKRRLLILQNLKPEIIGKPHTAPIDISYTEYANALSALSETPNVVLVSSIAGGYDHWKPNGVHLSDKGALGIAASIWRSLIPDRDGNASADEQSPVRTLIATKNRLWFHYYRPQNWAFLAGDRTNQPSSRDHLDPSKRWFPAELEKFVPLIDAKDAEIWALAQKLK